MYNIYKKISLLFSIITFVILFSVTSFSDTSANVTSEGTIVTTDGTTGNFGWVFENNNWRFIERDGEYAEDTMKKSNNNTYYIDENGYMAYDYLYTDDNNNTYYFSDTGAMVTHLWVAISPDKLENEKWNAEYFYMYFQDNGKAIKGKEGEGKKKTIEGKTYFFDEDGVMLTGWISKNGEHLDSENSDDWYGADSMYFALDDGSLAEGWLKWQDTNREIENDVKNINDDPLDMDVMWFYFEPKSHKKVEHTEKNINGQKYRFEEDTGRMYMQWEETEKLLPYIRLEYIESTYGGNQYIDSGFKPLANTKLILDYKYTGINQQLSAMICGARSGGDMTKRYYPVSMEGTNALQERHVKGSSRSNDSTKYLLSVYDSIKRHKVIFNDNNRVYTDGVDRGTFGWGFTPPNVNMYIFAGNGEGSAQWFAATALYGLQIYDGSRLARDFIPVKLLYDITNAYGTESHRDDLGLWDLVEEKFYPKKGGDDFVEGPGLLEYRHHGNDDDGSLAKFEWVYDVPSPLMSEEKYEEGSQEWFFAKSDGTIFLGGEKKINNKTYLFDTNGIMQKSLIIKYKPMYTLSAEPSAGYYLMRVDLDSTTGSDFIKKGVYYLKDDPTPLDNEVGVVAGHEDEPLYRENCINMSYTGNKVPYNIFYFGDDGAKRVGENINIPFSDGDYSFSSKKEGATFGFKSNKYYVNGILCKADPDIKYGILVDYSVFDTSTVGYEKINTKLRSLKPEFYNYNNYLCINRSKTESEVGTQITTANANLNKYYAHYPLLSVFTKGAFSTTELIANTDIKKISDLSNFSAKNRNCVFVVDNKGKKKKKGRYLDKQGNHWLIDKNNELVGIFTVPVKWGTVNGEDTPMYKSTFYETNGRGEQVEKEKYMPFFTRDAAGNTELDYVYEIDDEYIVNATVGEYKMGMN